MNVLILLVVSDARHKFLIPQMFLHVVDLGLLHELDIRAREGGPGTQREIVWFMPRPRQDGHPICMGPDQWETWDPADDGKVGKDGAPSGPSQERHRERETHGVVRSLCRLRLGEPDRKPRTWTRVVLEAED